MATQKIETGLIADSAVTTAKLADNSVTAAKIAAGSLDDQVKGISSSADAVAITIDSSENVGIGTDSPSGYRLNVSKGSTGNIAQITDGIAQTFIFRSDSNTLYAGNANNFSLAFVTNNTEKMTIDSSGNVGIGVVPSAWGANYAAIQSVQGLGLWTTRNAPSTILGSNAYNANEADDRYVNSNFASKYVQTGGIHSWYIAPSGTAGNAITYSEAMRIDSSGNVGIGGSPDTQLNIKNGDDAVVRIESIGSESGDDARLEIKTTNGTFTIQNDRSLGTSGALTFAGNTSDNLVIDHNDGTVGIGVSTPSGSGVLGTGHKLVTRANTNSGYVTTGGTGRLPAGLEIATQNIYQANDSLSGFAMQSNGAGGATMGGYIGFLPASTFGGGSVVIGATTGSNSHAERIRITNEGITFNGEAAAANALDDYEEGTFILTPNTGTISVQTCKYSKVGGIVTFVIEFTVGTGGATTYTGLPFATNGTCAWVPYVTGQTFAAGRTYPTMVVGATGTTIIMRDCGSGQALNSMAVTAGATYHACFSYTTDS